MNRDGMFAIIASVYIIAVTTIFIHVWDDTQSLWSFLILLLLGAIKVGKDN
jgi:hypothetical protein